MQLNKTTRYSFTTVDNLLQTLTALEAAEIATSIHVVFINRILLIVEKIALLCKMLQLPPVSPTYGLAGLSMTTELAYSFSGFVWLYITRSVWTEIKDNSTHEVKML